MTEGGVGQHFKADKVRVAIANILYNRKLKTWAFFAVQIFWDTQRELGAMLPVANKLLEGAGKDLEQSWTDYLDMKGLEDVGLAYKNNRAVIGNRLERLRFTVLGPQRQNALDKSEYAIWKLDVPGFSLLRNYPSMYGLLLLNIRDEHHRVAINMAGLQSQIMVSAHLYNAAHRHGLLPEDVHFKQCMPNPRHHHLPNLGAFASATCRRSLCTCLTMPPTPQLRM